MTQNSQVTSKILSSLEINLSVEALEFLIPILKEISEQKRKTILKSISEKIEKRKITPLLTKGALLELLIPKNVVGTLFENQNRTVVDKKEKTKRSSEQNKNLALSKYMGETCVRKNNKNISTEGQKLKTKNKRVETSPFQDPIIEVKTEEIELSSPHPSSKEQTSGVPFKFRELQNITNLCSVDLSRSFYNFFVNRYEKISKILKRKKLENLVNTQEIKERALEGVHSTILIVTDKRVVKNGNAGIIRGEDTQGRVTLYVPFRGPRKDKFNNLLKNTVVAFKFRKAKRDFLIVEDILFPNIPYPRKQNRASHSVKVLFLSDLHIGSKNFLHDVFDMFIDFIRGDTERKKEAVEIDYIIVVGDLVDGTGVYPNQRRELDVTKIEKQYEKLYEYLKRIPNDKEIILIPGNHDAAGNLLPQPPPPILKDLNHLSNVSLLSNPSMIEIEGVKILLFHGQGFEVIAGDIGIGIQSPPEITVQVLKNRHLCPIWDQISNFPTEEDELVIESTPDILTTGHLHVADYREYKGTLLLNPSAFQGKTSWQRELGIEPTPGLFPIVDLENFKVKFLDFNC